ncbi:MAG: ComEC/Rec2 family competence protein, partial [bacterium]
MTRAERIEKYLVFRPFVPLAAALIAGVLVRLFAASWFLPVVLGAIVIILLRRRSDVFSFLILLAAFLVVGYWQADRSLNSSKKTAEAVARANPSGALRFKGQMLTTLDTPWGGAYHIIRLQEVNGRAVSPIALVVHELCESEHTLALKEIVRDSDEWQDSVCAPDGYGLWISGEARYVSEAGPWFRDQTPTQFRWDYQPLWIEASAPLEPLQVEDLGWVERIRHRAVERAAAGLGCGDESYTRDYCTLLSIFLGQSIVKPSFRVKDSFRRAGLIHLLVPSGSHVMFLIMIILALGERLKWRRWTVVALFTATTLVMTVFFASLTIYRATGVALLFGLAQMIEVERDSLNSLCVAAASLLLISPFFLFDGGFQLSFAASVGIALTQMPMREVFARWPLVWRESLATGIPAQAFMIPVLLSSFHSLQIFSPLANLVAVPLAGVLLPIGLLASLLALIGIPLIPSILFLIIKPVLVILLGWGHLISSLPFSSIHA